MTYPQSTLEEIIDTERAMILDAPKRYGQHYKRARATTVLVGICCLHALLDIRQPPPELLSAPRYRSLSGRRGQGTTTIRVLTLMLAEEYWARCGALFIAEIHRLSS
jgi:hypothetical protein